MPLMSHHIRDHDIHVTSLMLLTFITSLRVFIKFFHCRVNIFLFPYSVLWKQVTKSHPPSWRGWRQNLSCTSCRRKYLQHSLELFYKKILFLFLSELNHLIIYISMDSRRFNFCFGLQFGVIYFVLKIFQPWLYWNSFGVVPVDF